VATISAQSIGQHASCAPTTDDDVIELPRHLRRPDAFGPAWGTSDRRSTVLEIWQEANEIVVNEFNGDATAI
jgi:hypothetical protein